MKYPFSGSSLNFLSENVNFKSVALILSALMSKSCRDTLLFT